MKKIKSNIRKNRYHRTLVEVCNSFIHDDPRKAWGKLKKLTQLFHPNSTSSHSPSSNVLRDAKGNILCTPQDLVKRFGEYYQALTSDVTGHSLDQQYWQERLGDCCCSCRYQPSSLNDSQSHPLTHPPPVWNINGPITMDEIEKVIRQMKNDKAPGPDGIPVEFYKAFFEIENRKDHPGTDHPGTNHHPGTSNNEPGYGNNKLGNGNNKLGNNDHDMDLNNNSDDDTNYSDCAKCLLLLFNKIWNGDFPSEWNTASIISVPKKGDLTDCNNYRGISLINIGLKILSKIVTDRISRYATTHNIIRPEQYGFRNKEESISLYISIREMCQRRRMCGDATYLAFLDLKKAFDSVPIYNILTKLYNMGIRGNTLTFITNLYLTSKAHATYHGYRSTDFPIHRGVRQGCPLSPVLFNLFINDILEGCDPYGIDSNGLKCCGSLFADDIVLLAPSKTAMEHLLQKVYTWAQKNEMSFGIQKCATLVVKPLCTDPSQQKNEYDPDPTFYLGEEPIPQTTCYTYLGIPFDENLSLDPIRSNLDQQLSHSLISFGPFLCNKSIPIVLKKYILDTFVLSHVHYIAPLLGYNPDRSYSAQSIINKGLLQCFGFKSDSNSDLDPDSYPNSVKGSVQGSVPGSVPGSSITFISSDSSINLYSLYQELRLHSLSTLCALAQYRCFKKWMNSSCVISYLVRHVPDKFNNLTWTQESQFLTRKLQSLKNNQAIQEYYDHKDLNRSNTRISAKTSSRTSTSFNNSSIDTAKACPFLRYQYGFFKTIHKISLEYPEYQLGFYWISRIRCGFKLDTRIAIEQRIVMNHCPTTCPCCGEGLQSFTHWILRCKEFQEARNRYLPFLKDLYAWLSRRIINQTILSVVLDSERDYDDNINYLLLNVLLGGQAVYQLLGISNKDRKLLIDVLFHNNKPSMSSDPYYLYLVIDTLLVRQVEH